MTKGIIQFLNDEHVTKEDASRVVNSCSLAMTNSFCKPHQSYANERFTDSQRLHLHSESLKIIIPLEQSRYSRVVFALMCTENVDLVDEPEKEGLFGNFAGETGFVPKSQFRRQMDPYELPPKCGLK